MPSREGSYELTSEFRNAKRDLDKELRDAKQRDLDTINRDLPSGHSQQAVRIEDACCGHLSRTAEKYWLELLEPAPLSRQRRSELFQRAINKAFQEVGACARKCGGYEAVESFRDEILGRDLVRLGAGETEDAANDTHAVKLSAKNWDAIKISFVSDERVQIHNGANSETRNYSELGFTDRRSGKPTKAWETLRLLATSGGMIRAGLDGSKAVKQRQGTHGAVQYSEVQGRAWKSVEKRMQEIRKVLRKHFEISADPIELIEGTGYQARFKINCSPSFDT